MGREPILERHDAPAAFQEPVTARHVGDVGELVLRDIKQLRKLYPVRRRLIEHNEELAVR